MLVSVPLMLEYEAVLTRPEDLNEFVLTAGEVGAILDASASVAERVFLPVLMEAATEGLLRRDGSGDGGKWECRLLGHFQSAAPSRRCRSLWNRGI